MHHVFLCLVHMFTFPAGKTGLEKEQEFIRKCMESLLMASANLEKDAHSSLTSIERGLLMLKTHLEAFRRRYGGWWRNVYVKYRCVYVNTDCI